MSKTAGGSVFAHFWTETRQIVAKKTQKTRENAHFREILRIFTPPKTPEIAIFRLIRDRIRVEWCLNTSETPFSQLKASQIESLLTVFCSGHPLELPSRHL